MTEKPQHLFTPDEVNALIPRLEEHFQNFWRLKENAQSIMEGLRAKDPEEMTTVDAANYQMKNSQAHFLLEQARKEIDAILEMGCEIKDFDMGLADFPCLLEDSRQEVHLCWKFGEKRVRFWHELDQGYASRKPLTKRFP